MLEIDVNSGEKVILIVLKNLVNPVIDSFSNHTLYRINKISQDSQDYFLIMDRAFCRRAVR